MQFNAILNEIEFSQFTRSPLKALLNLKSGAILLPINLSRRVMEANAAISTIQADIVKCNLNILSAIVSQATQAGQAIIDCISQSSSVNSHR